MNVREVPLTDEMFLRASKDSQEMGILRHSFTDGKGNISGMLAQQVFDVVYPESIKCEDFDKDRIYNGFKIDVKGRSMSEPPELHFDITVKVVKEVLRNDFFYFVGINKKEKVGYCLGWIATEDFLKSKIIKSNDYMAQGGNYKAGGYCIYVHQLKESISVENKSYWCSEHCSLSRFMSVMCEVNKNCPRFGNLKS